MQENLLGKCGFYCGCCPTYIKGGCKGCEDEHTEGDCYTRDCVLKQDIACCGICEQFPCDAIMTKSHTTVLDKDWLRWKKAIRTDKEKPMKDWFTIDQVDESTYVLSEYRHREETHCYLLIGNERALLIDTGLGICNICEQVRKLTDKPVTAVATHIHWDHIGGHKYFPDFYVHQEERNWLSGGFPLPVQAVRSMVADRCELPDGFDINAYEIFQGKPTRVLEDGDSIDLGSRAIQVLHTPGHSPGHLCFWEAERGYLFSGDLVYIGVLFANYPSTDPQSYLTSLEKIAALPASHIFPGHHSLDIHPEIVARMLTAFQRLNAVGKLHHGSGTYDYGDWAVQL